MEDLVEWRRRVATAHTLVTADGFASRLESFQANYGMFRSLVVGAIALLFVTPWSNLSLTPLVSVSCLLLAISLLGMHRFGVHYARELFAAVSAWSHKHATNLVAEGQGEISREDVSSYPRPAVIRRAA